MNAYFKKENLSPQVLLFSATLTEDIKYFIAGCEILRVKYFEAEKEALIVKGIKQLKMIYKNNEAKIRGLIEFYVELPQCQTIIFTNTKTTAEFLQQRISQKGFKCEILTSNLQTEQRD